MIKQGFASKFGTLMVLAGSSVGLGNLWKFPYTLGNSGGAAFLMVYLVCIALLGVPLLVAELTIGRYRQNNAIDAFGAGRFRMFGILSIITSSIVLAFYSTIGGWAIAYTYYYCTNAFSGFTPAEVQACFSTLITNPREPVFWQFLFMVATGGCLIGGVQKGLERASKIMMPILFLGLILLAIRALLLPGSLAGLKFMFQPDFSKINTTVILSAMGQAFFSLGLGMGIFVTYGAYLDKKENILNLAMKVAVSDTVMAIIAGIVIFPAVFAFGLKVDSGPSLLFITLPNVFNGMPLGPLWGALFFLLVIFAALTSSISLLEPPISYFVNNKNYQRIPTVIGIGSIIFLIGVPMTLSAGPLVNISLWGKSIFDFVATISDKILMVIVAIGTIVYAGWIMKKENFQNEVLNEGNIGFSSNYKVLFFLIRYVVPLLMVIILLQSF